VVEDYQQRYKPHCYILTNQYRGDVSINIYELIRKRYLSGEMSERGVRRCAKDGFITVAEAELIISLKPQEEEEEK